jgi:hypothetical protein
MAGHSRSKNGVALLAYVPAISIPGAQSCLLKRDRRDKPGDDGCYTTTVSFFAARVTPV